MFVPRQVTATWRRSRHLKRDDSAAEKSSQDNDRDAAYPDNVHLKKDVSVVMRAANQVEESPAGEKNKLLK